MRKTEKVKTKFHYRIPFILDPGKKILKKIVKKFKKLENLFSTTGNIFSQNGIVEAEKVKTKF